VIVGAGVSGLTGAALLAKRGYKVTLIDKNHVVGGYCTSFKRKGYLFDSCDHFINGVGKDEILWEILKELDVQDAIEYENYPISETLVFEDSIYKVPNDIQLLEKKLATDFPEENHGIEEVFEILRILRNREVMSPKFQEYYMMPFESFLNGFIKDDRLFSILVGNYAYIGNIQCPTIIMAYLMGNTKYYPKGGMQRFSDMLAGVAVKHNCEILLKKTVKEMIIEEGAVKGVKLESGACYYADAVISAVDAKHLYDDLVDISLTKRMTESLEAYKPSLSSFVTYIGTEMPMPTNQFDGSLVCIYDGLDANKRIDQDLGFKPDQQVKRLCIAIRQSGTKTTIMANCFAPYHIEGEWSERKKDMEKNLLSRIEKLIPGISQNHDFIESASPKTLERYTGNYEGGSYGFDRDLVQTRLFMKNYKSSIKGLFLVGHTAGGFYSGLAGSVLSAYDVVEYMKKTVLKNEE